MLAVPLPPTLVGTAMFVARFDRVASLGLLLVVVDRVYPMRAVAG